MFVCGFGEIFLCGYKQTPAQQEYRPGHCLGYLTDAEYEYAFSYVMKLRQSNELAPPSELDTLKKRLRQLVFDADSCSRLIKAARKRNPHKSEIDLYRDEIDLREQRTIVNSSSLKINLLASPPLLHSHAEHGNVNNKNI
ncbi:MAG: hypothetical protein ACHBN1_03725 [Heteroscytonema crispum UTEX LB 1556]